MDETTRTARQAVVDARAALSSEVDELGEAARSAVDIPAKIRRRPVQTVGLAAGAGFVALRGPKRVLRAVERRIFPSRARKAKGLLPKPIEKAIDQLGEGAAETRERIENEFLAFLEERAPKARKEADKMVGGRQSFWKTYDAIAVPASGLAVKRLIERLFAADRGRSRQATSSAEEGRAKPPSASKGR